MLENGKSVLVWDRNRKKKKKIKKKRIQIKGVDLLSYEAITNAVILSSRSIYIE